MKFTTNHITVALTLALMTTASSAVVAESNQPTRHHHLPPHMKVVEKGVKETQQLQAISADKKTQPTLTPSVKTAAQIKSSASCSVSASNLASASNADKINMLASSSDFQCLSSEIWAANNSLYAALFNENTMIAIANEAKQRAQNYDGSNANKLQNFILYLRVGYWAQWGNAAQIGEYTDRLTNANHAFLDTFAANSNFYNTDETHSKTASEVMILMNNFSSHRYLPEAEQIIRRYNKNTGYYSQSVMTQALTLLYRGSWNQDYRNLIETDPSILNTLDNFLATNTDLIGHNREYQYTDAVNELGRMLSYGGNTYERAKPLVKNVLDRFSLTGYGSSAWLKAAAQVEYADKDNCSYYGTCDFKTRLEQQVLPITHSCSSSLRVRAQDLTQAQLNQICDSLAEQETYFHQKLATGYSPVADDLNSTLEMIIYNSSADYQNYSGILFGHSTDNGGIYLEGDPSQQGNIPRFLAYEAEWLRPAFQVWNLEHEYVHYLDGRFNLYGDFATGNAHDTVWWSEGLAEYISKKNRNDGAVGKAKDKTFSLSTLFRTDYNKTANQIYDWGYLATRYMFEQQQPEVDNILSELRAGNYQNYDNLLNNYATGFDNSFSNWLDLVTSNDDTDPVDPVDPVDPTDPPSQGVQSLDNGDSKTFSANANEQQKFVIDIPTGSQNLLIETSGGTGEADLYVKFASEPSTQDYDYRPWVVGNVEKVEVATPQSGQWYIMINPDTDVTSVTVKVSWTEPALENACNTQTAQNYGELTSSQAVCVTESSASFYIWVPQGSSKLTIETEYGQGDASLYHKAVSWPTTSDYDSSSQQASSNNERVVINTPESAWHHVIVRGQEQGMTIKATVK